MQFRAAIITLLTIFISGFSYAQTISGKVTNSRNEPVTGASVTVEGKSSGTTTNIEGRYTLTLSPDKKYTIIFSAIGYSTKAISDVDAAQSQDELNVVLQDSAKAMEGIVVRATSSRRQENTTALLTFQKNNTAVSSVIAADFIRRTPDKNTGEVLKRVSGASIQDNKFVIIRGLADRYNSAYINGAQLPSSEPDKKAFSFDVIPSQLIDNIIINKTATPDLTGEFAGGLVQITTKDIPTKNMVSLGVSMGYNTLGSFKDFTSNPRGSKDWLGFSDRSLPSNYPKTATAYNSLPLQEQVAISRSFKDDVYRQVQSNSGPIQTYNLTWANAVKGNNGGNFGSVVGITYRQSKLVYVNDNAVVRSFPGNFEFRDNQNRYSVNWGAVANFAYTKGKHKVAFKNLFNQLLDDNYYTRTGTQEDNPTNLYSSVLNQRSLYTSQLEGSHGLFSDIKFNWNLNYSYNNKQQPDLRVQSYAVSPNDPNDRLLNNRGNNTNRFFSDLKDNSFGYSASITAPFNLMGYKQTLKVGGSALARIRYFKSLIFGYNDPADAALLRLPYDQIFNNENFREDGFRLTTDLQNPSDKYFAASALNAGYIMLDNKFSDKIRIIWGARVENFEQFLKSNQQSSDRALLIQTSKLDVLPSINFTFSPNSKTNFRLSGSKTVARPEFREIAPFAFFDFEQLASFSGNSSLRRTSIWNGDLRYELYPNAGELFSIGGFYKNFTDPIELTLDEGSSGTRRQYKFLNAQDANLLGAELEVRKSLSFLSEEQDWLSKLFFNGNLTYIYSKVNFVSQQANEGVLSSNRPLQGQSPYLINAGFQYDGKQLGLSLLYNRIGPRLSLVGNRTFDNIFENARNLLDFQVSKKVLKNNGELRLTVSDIFSQKIMLFWDQDDNYRYSSASDAVFSSYRPGTQFTLGFNYNFNL